MNVSHNASRRSRRRRNAILVGFVTVVVGLVLMVVSWFLAQRVTLAIAERGGAIGTARFAFRAIIYTFTIASTITATLVADWWGRLDKWPAVACGALPWLVVLVLGSSAMGPAVATAGALPFLLMTLVGFAFHTGLALSVIWLIARLEGRRRKHLAL